jgi:hypothetical protein
LREGNTTFMDLELNDSFNKTVLFKIRKGGKFCEGRLMSK